MSVRAAPVSARDRARLRAVLLSGLVCPGAGQLRNGAWARGLLLIAGTLWLAALMLWRTLQAAVEALPADPAALQPLDAWRLSWEIMERNRPALVPVTMGLLLLWLIGIVDAWLGAPEAPRGDAQDARRPVAKASGSGDTVSVPPPGSGDEEES